MEKRYQGEVNMARDEQLMANVGYGVAAGACTTAQGLVGNGMDPWKHRSQGMRCKTCMWFNPKAPQPVDGPQNPAAYDVGRCRRHAPTMGGYPVVFVNDWCGDHRLNENAI
jgi:hypothetical protein